MLPCSIHHHESVSCVGLLSAVELVGSTQPLDTVTGPTANLWVPGSNSAAGLLGPIVAFNDTAQVQPHLSPIVLTAKTGCRGLRGAARVGRQSLGTVSTENTCCVTPS